MSNSPSITVSSHDFDRLERLLESQPSSNAVVVQALRAELDRADVLEPKEMPPNIVTMNSTVEFRFVASGETFCKTLSYPADTGDDRLSILAPVGSALLGLAVGDTIQWPRPGGKSLDVQVNEILYQPERDGPRKAVSNSQPPTDSA